MLPPADRAYWRAPAGSAGALQYLAWGARQFGAAPIAESQHEGWSYVLVESGNPTLMWGGKLERVTAPSLLILGPDCRFGWCDHAQQTSKLLVWVWRQPIHATFAKMRPNSLLRFDLAACELTELRHLHALARNEIYRGDHHSEAALAGLQALLEARLARICDGSAADPRKEAVERALKWIQDHLDTRQPLARLADFLGVSPATVQRLFRERLGTTVMKIIAEIRRREAERMLMGKGVTIKEVAYRLGYRHPHDFSRAFRNHTGKLPSRRGLSERSPKTFDAQLPAGRPELPAAENICIA